MSAFPYIHETKYIIVLFIATQGVSVTHQRYNTISLYYVHIEAVYLLVYAHSDKIVNNRPFLRWIHKFD